MLDAFCEFRSHFDYPGFLIEWMVSVKREIKVSKSLLLDSYDWLDIDDLYRYSTIYSG
jgi:hypothetical protein